MKQWIVIILLLIVLVFSYLYTINQKVTVSFDTDGGEIISSIKIKKGNRLKLPDNPKKDGYTFIGWQYQGQMFNNNTKIIDSIKLKALYQPNKYVKISFDTDGGSSISSKSILYDQRLNIKDIGEPNKEGYIFDTWYYNSKPFDFNTKITKDIKLIAHFKKSGIFINNHLQIGDTVIILGNYAASAYDKYGYHTKAIGWTRTILNIYEGAFYPYQVGSGNETTGFFKVESLKKITSES